MAARVNNTYRHAGTPELINSYRLSNKYFSLSEKFIPVISVQCLLVHQRSDGVSSARLGRCTCMHIEPAGTSKHRELIRFRLALANLGRIFVTGRHQFSRAPWRWWQRVPFTGAKKFDHREHGASVCSQCNSWSFLLVGSKSRCLVMPHNPYKAEWIKWKRKKNKVTLRHNVRWHMQMEYQIVLTVYHLTSVPDIFQRTINTFFSCSYDDVLFFLTRSFLSFR